MCEHVLCCCSQLYYYLVFSNAWHYCPHCSGRTNKTLSYSRCAIERIYHTKIDIFQVIYCFRENEFFYLRNIQCTIDSEKILALLNLPEYSRCICILAHEISQLSLFSWNSYCFSFTVYAAFVKHLKIMIRTFSKKIIVFLLYCTYSFIHSIRKNIYRAIRDLFIIKYSISENSKTHLSSQIILKIPHT